MAKLTPIKAIRKKCLNCSNEQWIEVKRCPIEECPLWEYRLGRRPPKCVEGDFSPDDVKNEEIIDEDILD